MNDIKHFGLPGIGGSLGKCAICGETFLVEIVMNKTVQSFKVDNIEQILYAHDKCINVLKGIINKDGVANAKNLPDGPLKDSMIENGDSP